MLVAPSPVARSPPRLPSADHRLTIPERPSLASRRHISASLSPLHGSRPHRSSPLAGPSIAFAHDGTPKATSAPPTPSGGSRHLSPLAEFSTTAAQVDDPGDGDGVDSKKRRRRSLGAVLSKISFPSSGSSTSSSSSSSSGAEPSSPQRESPVRSRQRSRSASSRTAPPVPAVPPVPAWAHNTLPPRSMSPHKLSPSSSRAHTHSPGSSGSPKSSRPSSPTPSARSTTSRRSVIHTPIVTDPRTGSPVATRTTPSTSRNPEENWLTQSAAPRFSRLGLKAEGVVLPVSVREARRRSTASTLSIASTSRAKSFDALSPHSSSRPGSTARPSTVGHAPSSRMSIASTSTFTPSSVSHSSSSTPSHGSQSHSHSSPRHRSRTSSFASASSGRASIDCDTPSLTMSPGPSASDVSLAAPEVDEMGVLTRGVQLQLNDVPVGVIGSPRRGARERRSRPTRRSGIRARAGRTSTGSDCASAPAPAPCGRRRRQHGVVDRVRRVYWLVGERTQCVHRAVDPR
ncbi:hypothetical protein C8T65DRAFT_104294 [Cerioporus squamosus]|nr:hypothetical protein C8T65DRAFT_104294 [Cerioporus squamosus]